MNILVIKQTSLGDVLHATPHLRAIKAKYPNAHLTVLTAQTSVEIYKHNPHVDRIVTFDYMRFKQLGIKSPRGVISLFKASLRELNTRQYDLAFDLQGLLRSVVFLYLVNAKEKFVKGQWMGLKGFRNKQLHAIDEMSEVLLTAGISVANRDMEFARPKSAGQALKNLMKQQGLDSLLDATSPKPFVVISPFTRWASKNWPLDRFAKLAMQLSKTMPVLVTGTSKDKAQIDAAFQSHVSENSKVTNLAGELNLTELAELMSHARLVISGDSFPMHLATAVGAPLITLFGPTDERKTGPRSDNSVVVRPDHCDRCDNPRCERACLRQISVDSIAKLAKMV